MNAMLSLNFGEAKHMLMRRQQIPYRLAAFSLDHTKLALQVYLAYQRLYPQDFKEQLKKFMLPFHLEHLRDDPQVESLRNRIIGAVAALFPIEEDAIYQNMDEADSQVLVIEPQNYSMSWDEFSELIDDPGNLAIHKDTWAFPMLIWTLGYSVGDKTWDILSDNLGWNVKYPKRMVESDTYILMPRLAARLKKAGLSIFVNAIQVAWHDTGNYFFDFDPYDESNYEPLPPFTADSICDLKREYDKAKPIIEEYERAERMLRADPSIYQTLVDLMDQSLEERK